MKDLPKAYEFSNVEEKLYEWWEKEGFFKPSNDPNSLDFDPAKKPYVVSIPPPNVTGGLHLGHALFVAMEDLMIRYHRMKGIPTLWVPGTDHAGIATQLMVEKMLEEQGSSREELGREKFEAEIWAWKHKYGSRITQQIRRLGASCDWERERFTLDDGLSKAVREAFVRLYEKGLIYRGPRMINWSPRLKTAVSDLEVEYVEEPGFLYYFKYRLVDNSEEFIPVATTRPETILGDTAVAVHPEDERYQKYIGKKVLVPIINREIPVIADDYVDREFGTGSLKITPAHDPNDYDIGKRHKLEFISVLDKNAVINENGGPYQGLDRFACRKAIWNDMKTANLVIKEQPHTHMVPRSERGGEIIEPMISTQWFVTMKPLAEPGLEAVRNGEITIIPEHFSKIYNNWLENIQDWCISRQLWWGHRIPVWYCSDCKHITVSREDPDRCENCQSSNIYQDEDVLDTWFSSGLWPFSTLGWPEKTPDLRYFYPTTMMETGYDILFFWVARMIMFGLEFTGTAPFETVYLHGIIRDENGVKMSKTKGNSIDPLEVMDEMGTDALRFTVLVGSTPGNDTNVSIKKVEANRNFANKVWNAGRFVIGNLDKTPEKPSQKPQWTLADSWIWARMNQLLRDVERLFSNHQYGEAGRQIYDFFWSEFADWYLEIAKIQIAENPDRAFYTVQTLVKVMDNSLRLLHPFTPYVTEELWGCLKSACLEKTEHFTPRQGWEKALIIARWPEAKEIEGWEEEKIRNFNIIQEIVRTVRNIRTEKKLPPSKKIPATIVAGEKFEIIMDQLNTIIALANLDKKETSIFKDLEEKPINQTPVVISGVELFLPLEDLIDVDAEKERINKELSEIQSQITRLENLLNSPFGEKAPAAVVQKEKEKLSQFTETSIKLKQQLDNLA
ncbi:MAG: valine--tRNA ligase [Chloroflexi bacterium HGW-Chloroflexi-3]|nr:MAG: valine--tRNA ligase [Chloroflexi bacterium HGW-Chloroflexi-3]